MLCVGTAPFLLDEIYVYCWIWRISISKIYELARNCVCSASAYVINNICKSVYGGRTPLVYSDDIYDELRGLDPTHYIAFLKKFAVAVLFNYAEKSLVAGYVVDVLYNYGVIIEVDSVDSVDSVFDKYDDSRARVFKILMSRKYALFGTPKVLAAVIDIYRTNPSGTFMSELRQNIKVVRGAINRFITMYSICSVFTDPLVGAIGSFGLLMTRNSHTHTIFCDDKRWLVLSWSVGAVVGFTTGNVIYGLFISEFFEFILNKLTRHVWGVVLRWCALRLYLLHHYNLATPYICMCGGVLVLIGSSCDWKYFIVMSTMTWLSDTYSWIGFILLFIGWLSSYNIVHVTVLGVIIYLGINISKMNEAQKPKLDIKIIKDYYGRESSLPIPKSLSASEFVELGNQ
jgi:hypothetical protein